MLRRFLASGPEEGLERPLAAAFLDSAVGRLTGRLGSLVANAGDHPVESAVALGSAGLDSVLAVWAAERRLDGYLARRDLSGAAFFVAALSASVADRSPRLASFRRFHDWNSTRSFAIELVDGN